MKEYNFYMIDVVAKLRQKGYPVSWTIYGEGSYANAMKARIDALGLSEAIKLKGMLEYSKFAEAMQHAYLFVGGGTSIVEAALCGVPGIMAFAFDTSGATYGSLYDFPFGNLGLRTGEAPGTTVEAEIERIIKLEKHDYEEEIKRNREYAQAYSMDVSMDKFLGLISKASVVKISYSLFYYGYAHMLVGRVLEKAKLFTKRLKLC
jgi:glycosyltransferase involved in cell wall biosynthesis